MEIENADTDEDAPMLLLESLSSNKPIKITMRIEEKDKVMELDTGGAVSAVSEELLHKELPGMQIKGTKTRLKPYVGNIVEPLGKVKVDIEYEGQRSSHELCH